MRTGSAAILLAVACVPAHGCGRKPPGRRSFDVTASLTANDPQLMDVNLLPLTSAFTLTLDPEAGVVIGGAFGGGAALPATTTDGQTYRATGELQVLKPGSLDLSYESFELTLEGASLRGHGEGKTANVGHFAVPVEFTAALLGDGDVTPPQLLPALSSALGTPFMSVAATSSEPLPPEALAVLVDSDDAEIELTPAGPSGGVPFVTSFGLGPRVLPYGKGYWISAARVVDFAGNHGTTDLVRVGMVPTPPLVAQDGLESLSPAGALGGGTVVATGDAVPPISGARSVYIGTLAVPAVALLGAGRSLTIRLALHPGDKTIRFSHRSVSSFATTSSSAEFYAGTVGGTISYSGAMVPSAPGTAAPSGAPLFLGEIQAATVALPLDAHDEAVLTILIPDDAGMLIDDFEVE